MLRSNKFFVHEFIISVSVKIIPTILIISHFLSCNYQINVHFKTIYHTYLLLDLQRFTFTQTKSEQISHVSYGPTEHKA